MSINRLCMYLTNYIQCWDSRQSGPKMQMLPPCGCISHLHPFLQVDPAAFEISGHVIFKHAKDYDTASQDNIWRLLSYASYTEADVLDMARMALAL